MASAPTTPRPGYRAYVAELAGRQKPARGVPAYTMHVNRPIGRRVAALAAVVGLGPDLVTWASAALSVLALVLLAVLPPSGPLGVVVAVLLAVGFVLDSADGQLARLRGGGSPTGEFLDHVLDCTVKTALHGAVLIAWYRSGVDGALLLLPLAFQLVAVVTFFGGILVGKLRQEQPTATAPGGAGLRRAVLMTPLDHGVLCWSFVLWGWQDGFRAVYGALAVLGAAGLAAYLVRWWRELAGGR